MTKPDSLFLLIKSMTKAEKRHFKLTMSKYRLSGAKDYLRLFDAIDLQPVYDEKALVKKFKDEPYFKNMASVKQYLHRQILKSLKALCSDVSIDMKLNNYLLEIEILYRKELFRDCADRIKKAKTFATRYEKLPKLLELLAWESKVANQVNDVGRIESLKSGWKEEESLILEKCNEIKEMNILLFDLQSFSIRKGVETSYDDKIFIQHVLSQPVLKREMKSFQGQINKLIALAICAISSNYEEKYTALNNAIEYFEIHPHQIDEYINVYFGLLLELIAAALSAKKFFTSERIFKKLASLYYQKERDMDLKNKIGFLNVETTLFVNRGQISSAVHSLHKTNDLVKNRYKDLDPVEEIFSHALSFIVHFINKDFKTAQHHIMKIINHGVKIRTDVQSAARVANLILQFEQNEYDHLGYMMRSAYRFLLKQRQLLDPEILVFNFLKKALKFTSEKQLLHELAAFRTKILPYTEADSYFLLEFPVIEWIDSKLQKRELAGIVKENYLKALAKEESENLKIAV